MDRLDRIEAGILALQISQAKTDEQISKLEKSQTKTDEQLAKTEAQVKETSRILSNVGINLGMVAEEYFYYALKSKMKLGNIKYDNIEFNLKARFKKIEDEFDLVMYNGNSIAIIEVKHKVHPNDLETLKTKKIENFKILFPYYADYKMYLGIAGMSILQDIENLAHTYGMAVLRQQGETVTIDDKHLIAY